MHKILTLKALDVLLDGAADDPESFVEFCDTLADSLDRDPATIFAGDAPKGNGSATAGLAADLEQPQQLPGQLASDPIVSRRAGDASKGVELEIADPIQWRSSAGSPRSKAGKTNFLSQFRADVESIQIMGRAEEARHARRIEFARIRLERARRAAGLPESMDLLRSHEDLPPLIQRRAEELHALRTELVERNLYLVLINVERYRQRAGASRMDLIQEGCVSLFRAVDGFDWRRGLLFRTYAVHWLNQAFRNYLYNHGQTVRVPVYLQKAIKHIHRAADRLEDPLASHNAIAEEGELNETLVKAALTACRSSFSIDADHSLGGDGSRLRDLLVDEDYTGPYSSQLEDVGLADGLSAALDSLSEREELVVRMRFGVGKEREHTLSEVAKLMGVSVERIRQIQVRALSKMKTPGLRKDLDPFLN